MNSACKVPLLDLISEINDGFKQSYVERIREIVVTRCVHHSCRRLRGWGHRLFEYAEFIKKAHNPVEAVFQAIGRHCTAATHFSAKGQHVLSSRAVIAAPASSMPARQKNTIGCTKYLHQFPDPHRIVIGAG